jgi:hypothetical protein
MARPAALPLPRERLRLRALNAISASAGLTDCCLAGTDTATGEAARASNAVMVSATTDATITPRRNAGSDIAWLAACVDRTVVICITFPNGRILWPNLLADVPRRGPPRHGYTCAASLGFPR